MKVNYERVTVVYVGRLNKCYQHFFWRNNTAGHSRTKYFDNFAFQIMGLLSHSDILHSNVF
jgi:hypothetical protein